METDKIVCSTCGYNGKSIDMKLQGIFAPMTTPFDHRGDLYVAKIHYNISRWNRTRLAGYVVGGACGEGRTLSFEEKHRLWEEAADVAAEDKLLVAGLSVDGVQEAVRALSCAAALGYKAAAVEPPQWPRPWIDEPGTQALFFRAVADQSKLPVVMVNPRPPHAVRLSPETLLLLAQHPNIAGVIEQSTDAAVVPKLLEADREDFQILGGEDSLLSAALGAGAVGAVVALANAAPFFCLSIEEAVRTREMNSAEELQQRVSTAAAITARYGIGGLKHAMDLQAFYGGNPRLPLTPAGEEAKREIAAAFHGINS